MNAPACLHIAGLHVELGAPDAARAVVQGVDIRIEAGQTYCLVGESGSGKSVTALSILGLLPEGRARARGSIRFTDEAGRTHELLGAAPETLAAVRGGHIGMIFQEPMSSLNPVMTIGEQLDEALRLHCPEMTAQARRAAAIAALEEVLLPEAEARLSEYPHRLSGGQRQRVMIAMALICRPRLLIADEPTTALDVTVQAEILALLVRLRQSRGMAMLFITHDFGVVAQVAEQIGVMHQGRLVEQGAAAEILHRPQHEYTRALLAALPERLPRPPRRAPVSGAPLLDARSLAVRFARRGGLLRRIRGWHVAVDGVSFAIRPGEVLALVGESGCGKTTLAHAIARLQTACAGEIRLADGLHLRQAVQMVFQDPGASLNPRLPVAVALTEPMRAHRIGANDAERLQHARELLVRVGLPPESLHRYPHEFSGGQRQRIAIARALATRPRLIICDEITSALDVSVQAGILRLLHELVARDQLSLLFITHNMGVVEWLADRVAVMHGGRIVETGATDEVFARPSHPYTQRLLAGIPRLR